MSHKSRKAVGESKKEGFGVGFDARLKLELHGSKVTSDGGLLLYRELDEALGLTAKAGSLLQDIRTGKITLLGLVALLRQSVFSGLAGYEDTNRLCATWWEPWPAITRRPRLANGTI